MAVGDEPDVGNLYDILDFLTVVFFNNLYSSGSYTAHCKMYIDDPEMVQCPTDNYFYLASLVKIYLVVWEINKI